MSHARILRHTLLWALRRQGGQRHCDKLQRHAEKLQYSGDGEHTRSRICRTIRQSALQNCILGRCIHSYAKRKAETIAQGSLTQLCCLHEAKTENSEYEKRRRLHLQSSPLRFEALFSGCQNSALKSQEPKQFKNEKIGDTCRAEPRFPRDLVTRRAKTALLARRPLRDRER